MYSILSSLLSYQFLSLISLSSELERSGQQSAVGASVGVGRSEVNVNVINHRVRLVNGFPSLIQSVYHAQAAAAGLLVSNKEFVSNSGTVELGFVNLQKARV